MTTTQKVSDYLAVCQLPRNITPHVASALRMSPVTLRRLLREEGTTLAELVRAEKIRRVQSAISERPMINAKRLAGECGYADVEHFYRAFKSWFGQGWEQYSRGIQCSN